MRIAHTADEIRRQLKSLRHSKSIAFVPTMGCLHDGHLRLIRQAKQMADVVVVSIYVNPLQFGAGEDLDAYPRTFDDDARVCAEAGVDFIFHPDTLYPKNGPKVTLQASQLADCLCGASRPGHFDGVLTVVNILFNIIQPDLALFGEKDWQQLSLIRRMVSDLQMPIDIIAVAIVREADGLAMSSRNRYLSAADREQGLVLSQALMAMQQAALAGESDVDALKAVGLKKLAAAGVEPEYLDIRHPNSLKNKRKLNPSARVFVAARIGSARLIDNMPLTVATCTEESR